MHGGQLHGGGAGLGRIFSIDTLESNKSIQLEAKILLRAYACVIQSCESSCKKFYQGGSKV